MIEKIINQIIENYNLTPIEINSAYCYSFAEDIETLLYENGLSCEILNNENFFIIDNDINIGWSNIVFEKYNLSPPSFNSIDIDENYHVFIYFENKFYDAECIEGKENWLHLPFYQRILNQ